MGCGCADVDDGGGGGGGATITAFRYTADGSEGSDFFIPLPAAQANDSYFLTMTTSGVTELLVVDLPDIAAGDRTTTQFRVITSAAVQLGDQFDIFVAASS